MTLKVYIDASGTETDRKKQGVVAAGVAGTLDDWKRLDKCWEPALIDPSHPRLDEYHASVLDGLAYYQEKGWDKDKLHGLHVNLFQILRGCGFQKRGFACGIRHEDYDYINGIYRVEETIGGEYAFAVMGLVRLLRQLLCGWSYERAAQCFLYVDGKDTGWPELKKWQETDPWKLTINEIPRIVTDINGNLSYVRAFEAADLLAYEVRHGKRTVEKGKGPEDYKPCGVLLDRLEPRTVWEDRVSLDNLCHVQRIPKRKPVNASA